MSLRIGVDVGGTNTDAVLMSDNRVIAKIKTPTSEDVTSGITTAIRSVLDSSQASIDEIRAVMIGTTHFTNAIVERRQLQRVGVIRIGLPATTALPPFIEWPDDLVTAIDPISHLVGGGYEFDGRALAPFDESAVRTAAEEFKKQGIAAVAVSCVFSPVNSDLEERAAQIIAEVHPEAVITLSNEIGRVGLIERENAAILNSTLRGLATKTVAAFERSVADIGIKSPLFLTQNDGTLMLADYARSFPVLTIASGPTNSMRGAAFLSGITDGIVVDIGGTTTDVGVLTNGFPREASVAVEVGGVRTNFRMPDVYSIGLGGGSLVDLGSGKVGPQSVGYRLTREARVFGGDNLTATDIVVAAGKAEVGDAALVEDIPTSNVDSIIARMQEMVAEAVDRMKTSAEPLPVIVVGGGSILVVEDVEGSSVLVKPDHFEAANAVGAAIAQVSGEIDRIYSLDHMSRNEVLADAKSEATSRAVEAGADASTIAIVDVEDVPLAYLPGNATRVRVKVVGELMLT